MIIESLSVNNFRVFKGRHHIDLSPRSRWNAARPIILFGGLNGAGKTTILTAIRLALYGRHSLGQTISARGYQDYLRSSVHVAKSKMFPADHASVEISFYYAHMGIKNHYQVTRSWVVRGKRKVSEQVEIHKDKTYLRGLNDDQKQGLLNELIPVGVSDLFFFDGEKIADLAADQSGAALSEAIKKLLGLDLIERLSGDLAVIIRNYNYKTADSKTRDMLKKLELELDKKDCQAKEAEEEYRQLMPQLAEQKALYEFEEREFLAKGGGWAVARSQLVELRANLETKRDLIQQEIREVLAGAYPISLAATFCQSAMNHLMLEYVASERATVMTAKVHALEDVRKRIESVLSDDEYAKASAEIDQILGETTNEEDVERIHNIGERQASNLTVMYAESQSSKQRLQKLAKQLAEINTSIEEATVNITRSPEENTIEVAIRKLNYLRNQVAEFSMKCDQAKDRAKTLLREAADLARNADKKHLDVSARLEADRYALMARGASALLEEYVVTSSEKKIVKLEEEFNASFARLARKKDLQLSAKIDPHSFKISLKAASGHTIDKNDLSAGERQIYAIAMLESIAKTSGRKLPVIIDTPLGRLDSKHRERLIENYFPTASHQVIILSTDTEVDEVFYSDLYKYMSHAYELRYDAESGSTQVEEGYFWKTKSAKGRVA